MLEQRVKIHKMLGDLQSLLERIDKQEKILEEAAVRLDIPVTEMQDKNGRWLWLDLLGYRAHCYDNIATLEELLERIDRSEKDAPPRT